MKTVFRSLILLVLMFVAGNAAQAQFGFIQKGLDAAKGGKSGAHNVADEKTGGKGYATA